MDETAVEVFYGYPQFYILPQFSRKVSSAVIGLILLCSYKIGDGASN